MSGPAMVQPASSDFWKAPKCPYVYWLNDSYFQECSTKQESCLNTIKE